MKNIEVILDRCDDLIEKAKEIIDNKEEERVNYIITSIENILNLVYSGDVPDHLRFENFLERIPIMLSRPTHTLNLRETYKLKRYLEIFKAFTDDLRHGLISNLANIVSIDIFENLIEQAKELRTYNTEPLNRSACVLARIVLQDTLLRICDDRNINLSTGKASNANSELKKKAVYPKSKWREVQSWLDIGNTAAHPDTDFKKISKSDMDKMIENIEKFTKRYLS